MTLRMAIAAVAVVVVVAPAGTWPAAQAASTASAYQRQAFKATNKQRVERDRIKLRHQQCVQRYAVRWARHMAETEELVHQDLDPIMDDCGLNLAGENIAYGFPSGKSVVNQGWMHSEGHRANILKRDYRLMGIGARRDDDGRWWVSQVFGRAG